MPETAKAGGGEAGAGNSGRVQGYGLTCSRGGHPGHLSIKGLRVPETAKAGGGEAGIIISFQHQWNNILLSLIQDHQTITPAGYSRFDV